MLHGKALSEFVGFLQYTSRAAQLYRQQLEKDASKIKLDEVLQGPPTPTAASAATSIATFSAEPGPTNNAGKVEGSSEGQSASDASSVAQNASSDNTSTVSGTPFSRQPWVVS